MTPSLMTIRHCQVGFGSLGIIGFWVGNSPGMTRYVYINTYMSVISKHRSFVATQTNVVEDV